MARERLNCFVWLVDTLRRHGRLTFAQISDLWQRHSLSEGKPLPQRTFHRWRDAVEEMFDINIACDRTTYEYYIEQSGDQRLRMQDWLLDSMAISDMLRGSHDITDRIVLENVPSARHFLATIVDAMRQNVRIGFSYQSYARSLQVDGIILEPYFVKIFKQRWYVIGLNVGDRRVKTYALDRMSALRLRQSEPFTLPPDISPTTFFADCFGIITNQNSPREVVLRVESRQAKYFRALPLHPSQTEERHDTYSVFRYRMRITYDLREELLSHGADVEVVEPPELKAQIVDELRRALALYPPEQRNPLA